MDTRPAATWECGEERVEGGRLEDGLGRAACHAGEGARVLEEVDDPLVIEMARQKPRVPLHAGGIGELPAPPLQRGAIWGIGERANHVVLQGAIARRAGHGVSPGSQRRNRTTAVRPSETTFWPETFRASVTAPGRRM